MGLMMIHLNCMGAVGYHVRLATPSIPLAILVQSEDGN